jgi:hypothetical protein
MQLFIAKEQFGDYLNYVLNTNQIKVNLINSIVLPAYFKYKYGPLLNEQAKNELYTYISIENLKTAGLTNQTTSNITIKNVSDIVTEQITIDNYLINLFGIADEIITENGKLKKIKKWEKESVAKTTTFSPTSKSGKNKCILIDTTTNKVYVSVISGTNIEEKTIPDGSYIVLYQLVTPETINLPYLGDLHIYEGNNNIELSPNLTLEIKGRKKYVKG